MMVEYMITTTLVLTRYYVYGTLLVSVLVEISGLDSETLRFLVATLMDTLKAREGSRKGNSPSAIAPNEGQLAVRLTAMLK